MTVNIIIGLSRFESSNLGQGQWVENLWDLHDLTIHHQPVRVHPHSII